MIQILFTLVISQISWAERAESVNALFPKLTCPGIGQEYSVLIAELDRMKAVIKKEQCSNAQNTVKSLEDLLGKDRTEVVEIVESANGEPLTAEQAKKVRDYAENVTKKIAALNDFLLQNNTCFADDARNQRLPNLAGFVSEASQLLGQVTGPWGTPIQIAGTVVAGFLTGMDQILKSRQGYDFADRKDWVDYVNNLCAYYNLRDQIDHLLDPEKKIHQLEEVKTQIEHELALNSSSSPRGRNLDLAANSTMQNQALREWIIIEIVRIRKEARSSWAQSAGQHALYRAKNDLEQFLQDREAPRFLAYQIRQARTDHSAFQYFANSEGRTVYELFANHYPSALEQKVEWSGWSRNPEAYFKALVATPPRLTQLPNTDAGDEARYVWKHFRDQSLDLLNNAWITGQVAEDFCEFFRSIGAYSAEVRGNCRDRSFVKLREQQSALRDQVLLAN